MGSRPLADEATEKLAHDIFPTHMSPGEYAARHGDEAHGCFGYDGYRYRDEQLDRWIQAVSRILSDPMLLAAVRERALES